MIAAGLSLALGARGSAQLVRAGARAAKVQARFDAPRRRGGVGRGRRGHPRAHDRRPTAAARRASAGQLTTASALAELGAAPRRDPRAASVAAAARRRDPDRRSWTGSPAPSTSHGRGLPTGVRGAARRADARSPRCARRPAIASARSTCSATRCARSRPSAPRAGRDRRAAAPRRLVSGTRSACASSPARSAGRSAATGARPTSSRRAPPALEAIARARPGGRRARRPRRRARRRGRRISAHEVRGYGESIADRPAPARRPSASASRP